MHLGAFSISLSNSTSDAAQRSTAPKDFSLGTCQTFSTWVFPYTIFESISFLDVEIILVNLQKCKKTVSDEEKLLSSENFFLLFFSREIRMEIRLNTKVMGGVEPICEKKALYFEANFPKNVMKRHLSLHTPKTLFRPHMHLGKDI